MLIQYDLVNTWNFIITRYKPYFQIKIHILSNTLVWKVHGHMWGSPIFQLGDEYVHIIYLLSLLALYCLPMFFMATLLVFPSGREKIS